MRSEAEYEEGHIKGAVNVPILNNDERKIVGTLYKQAGQTAAVREGISLVGPRLGQIIANVEKVAGKDPVLVHCWRGGMRSNNFCWLVERVGVKTFALKGGYKSYRQKAQEAFGFPLKLIVISGSTGSGKTEVLRALKSIGEQVIDLEHLANHKGSAFGAIGQGSQPTTEQFHNDLFEAILGVDLTKRIWVEDESVTIGKVFLPDPFWKKLGEALTIRIDVDKSLRVQRLVRDYGKADKEMLLNAMEKIVKKLGGQHFKAAKEKLLSGDLAATAEILLTYYDKAYEHGIKKHKERIIGIVSGKDDDATRLAEELVKRADNF